MVHAFQANSLIKGKLQDPHFIKNHSHTNQTTSPLLPIRDPMGLDHRLQRGYLILLDFLMTFAGNLLEIWWSLMGMDRNYRGIGGNYREIDLIQGSHPP